MNANYNNKNQPATFEAPMPASVQDAVEVLKGMKADRIKKVQQANTTNALAASIIGKSMGLDSNLFGGILAAQSQQSLMELAGLEIAIEALETFLKQESDNEEQSKEEPTT